MISHRTPRRARLPKMPKNIERLYKDGKCRDCAVVVTRMDFAKILGKFTKVKIQYESNSSPKTKKVGVSSPNPNARLKSNENGMVLLHRNAYKPHPVKEHITNKRVISSTPRQASNVLKENNRLKKTPITKAVSKDKNANLNVSLYDEKSLRVGKSGSQLKHYGIIFVDPSQKKSKNETKSKTSLDELISVIGKNILPSEEWCIEYLPLKDERTDDKVYDRIAAELEDLMYNEKPEVKPDRLDSAENKADDFPSIMDILNDSSSESKKTDNQSNPVESKSNLESSDVEAMLLGKSSTSSEVKESITPMEVDTSDVTKLIEDVAQLNSVPETAPSQGDNEGPSMSTDEFENPHSPSILDETLQKGIEEHLPLPNIQGETVSDKTESTNHDETEKSEKTQDENVLGNATSTTDSKNKDFKNADNLKPDKNFTKRTDITHVTFKKKVNGTCQKSVTCPKDMKYNIEIEGKQVELIGAPKFISSLEDLEVLLQIVDDTDLQSLYIHTR